MAEIDDPLAGLVVDRGDIFDPDDTEAGAGGEHELVGVAASQPGDVPCLRIENDEQGVAARDGAKLGVRIGHLAGDTDVIALAQAGGNDAGQRGRIAELAASGGEQRQPAGQQRRPLR